MGRESKPRFSLSGWLWVWFGACGGVGGELWLWPRSKEGLWGLERVVRGSVDVVEVVVIPFWVVKELSVSEALGGVAPTLGGLVSGPCCWFAIAASLSLADLPESWALSACSREYCWRWASLDSSRAN